MYTMQDIHFWRHPWLLLQDSIYLREGMDDDLNDLPLHIIKKVLVRYLGVEPLKTTGALNMKLEGPSWNPTIRLCSPFEYQGNNAGIVLADMVQPTCWNIQQGWGGNLIVDSGLSCFTQLLHVASCYLKLQMGIYKFEAKTLFGESVRIIRIIIITHIVSTIIPIISKMCVCVWFTVNTQTYDLNTVDGQTLEFGS